MPSAPLDVPTHDSVSLTQPSPQRRAIDEGDAVLLRQADGVARESRRGDDQSVVGPVVNGHHPDKRLHRRAPDLAVRCVLLALHHGVPAPGIPTRYIDAEVTWSAGAT